MHITITYSKNVTFKNKFYTGFVPVFERVVYLLGHFLQKIAYFCVNISSSATYHNIETIMILYKNHCLQYYSSKSYV